MTDQHGSTALAAARTDVDAGAAGDFDRLRELPRDDVVIALPNSGANPTPGFVFSGVEEASGYPRSSFGIAST